MEKVALGPQPFLMPVPVVLVGTRVDGQENFTTISWTGIVNSEPPMLGISLRPARHGLRGLELGQGFSVCIPSQDSWRETDFCGVVSGAKTDKSRTLGPVDALGSLQVPVPRRVPLAMECAVEQILPLGSHHLVLGRILEVWADPDILTEGKPDGAKVRPFVYTLGSQRVYWTLGEVLGTAYSQKTLDGLS